MALTLPIYKRHNTFILYLRVAGRQIKRSLGMLDLLQVLSSQSGPLDDDSVAVGEGMPGGVYIG
jgi:hypothetical protein